MRIIDFLIGFSLFGLFMTSLYFLWINLPTQLTEFQEYKANIAQDLPLSSSQFYAKMRYADKRISYTIFNSCTSKEKSDFVGATKIIEAKTVLTFYEVKNGEIEVTCPDTAPSAEESGHFIAGEGGPSLFLNTSNYAIITSGKVVIYRPEKCATPQIALHEIIHALGFDHNNNEESIMFPVTDCKQTIDQYLVEEINKLYEEPSLGDLVIESVSANKTGPYLSFTIVVANIGLRDIKNTDLKIIIENELIREFELEEIEIGSKKQLSITNLRIPRNTKEITLAVETAEQEIDKSNNDIKIISQE